MLVPSGILIQSNQTRWVPENIYNDWWKVPRDVETQHFVFILSIDKAVKRGFNVNQDSLKDNLDSSIFDCIQE